MDLVIRSPRIPVLGETIIGGDFRTVPGGKGANQAVAAGRLGAQVSMVGCVGQDDFATSLLNSLAEAEVDHSYVIQDPSAATGVALITVDDAGENSIVVAPGANMRLSPIDIDAIEPVIAAANVLLLQLESPLETVTRAAEIAHAHGATVVLNPAPAPATMRSSEQMVRRMLPCNSITLRLPARWCRPSTFWVINVNFGKRCSSSASARWPGLGLA